MKKQFHPEFRDRDIRLIGASLPNTAIKWRVALLPKILGEWRKTDLLEHLTQVSRSEVKKRNKKLSAVSKRAASLEEALAALGDADRFSVSHAMAKESSASEDAGILTEKSWAFDSQIHEQLSFLRALSFGASQSIPKPGRGNPRNLPAYLVIRDIAAIFNYMSGQVAARSVGLTDAGDDGLREKDGEARYYGEKGAFMKFASSIWPVVFGRADDGLGAALKNWSPLRNKEESALISNIHMRHPEWRVFRRKR